MLQLYDGLSLTNMYTIVYRLVPVTKAFTALSNQHGIEGGFDSDD